MLFTVKTHKSGAGCVPYQWPGRGRVGVCWIGSHDLMQRPHGGGAPHQFGFFFFFFFLLFVQCVCLCTDALRRCGHINNVRLKFVIFLAEGWLCVLRAAFCLVVSSPQYTQP